MATLARGASGAMPTGSAQAEIVWSSPGEANGSDLCAVLCAGGAQERAAPSHRTPLPINTDLLLPAAQEAGLRLRFRR